MYAINIKLLVQDCSNSDEIVMYSICVGGSLPSVFY